MRYRHASMEEMDLLKKHLFSYATLKFWEECRHHHGIANVAQDGGSDNAYI